MREQQFIDAQAAALDDYGVMAEERYVGLRTVEGCAHVLVVGEGPPVIMINGIGTPAAMWAPLMARLEGCTLYAVDLPGFGLTDGSNLLTANYREVAVGFLDGLLDGLGLDRTAFVANSLGSLWSAWFSIDRSRRVTALAHVGCPAVVLNTSAPLPMRLLSARPLGRLMMRLQPPSPRQVKQLSKMVREYPLPSSIAGLLLATERLPAFERTFLRTLHTLIRLRGARPEMALTIDELAQIEQPSLLVFGRYDPMGGASVGERVAKALPDAELHMVDGGHAPWVHHADQIGPVVTAFLTRVLAADPPLDTNLTP